MTLSDVALDYGTFMRTVMADIAAFDRFKPALAQVLDERRYTMDWVERQVCTGQMQAWIGTDAIVLTRVEQYPTGAKDVHAMLAVGDLDEIVAMIRPRIEAWAKQSGCLATMVESRAGWERALKRHGYMRYQATLRKDL